MIGREHHVDFREAGIEERDVSFDVDIPHFIISLSGSSRSLFGVQYWYECTLYILPLYLATYDDFLTSIGTSRSVKGPCGAPGRDDLRGH